jgi:hypothetical protein
MYDSTQSSLVECTPYSPLLGWFRPIYMALPHEIGKFRWNSTPAAHPFWYPVSLLPAAPTHHCCSPPSVLLTIAPGWWLFLLTNMPAPTHWCEICCLLVGPLMLPATPPHWHTRSGSLCASSPVCPHLLTAKPAPRYNSSQAVDAIRIKISIPICEVLLLYFTKTEASRGILHLHIYMMHCTYYL